MLLLLQRSPEQEAALEDFLQDAHTPGNAAFHQWIKPEEFGRLYGPADSDVSAVTGWLESHGLTVNRVNAGRLAIEFSGTAGQVSEAFQTEIHRYQVNGETHLANATNPSVPAALAPVIAGLVPVNDFHPKPRLAVLGEAQFNARTHETAPQWTYPSGSGEVFLMTPGDFAVQYDINSVYKSGITGSGQTIAIISASNVDLSLVQAYQTLFGISTTLPQVVVDGTDPGLTDAATEAYLDLEVAGSVAPGASVVLYTSGGTVLTDGLSLAALRAVEDDVAGIISTSYGECELELGQSGNAFWNALWQQAAAQGQSVFVSAGDNGAAGCDDFDTQQVAYSGLQVNGIASTPYNVAVGGTDFYYSQYAGSSSAINTQLSTYWTTSTTTSPAVSLVQAVPEQAWNDFFGYNLADGGKPATLASQVIIAGSGGMSSSALYSGTTGSGYSKPAWQTGTGVPADGVRDLPDLSLFAANGYNYSFYPVCANPGDCSSGNLNGNGTEVITGVGGTSVSSPSMAAIQALVNQSTGSWQGQADFIYYPLAAHQTPQTAVFRDVTVGGNHVACYATSANCVAGSSATNSSGYNIESGYSAGTGFDLATGLGSVDVANLIKYWSTVTPTATKATLSVSPTTLIHGKTVTISGTVSPASGSGTPTGTIGLTGNDGVTHSASIASATLSAGSFSALVDNLPGGTYQLTANYGGDGTFAASKSSPVTVTVTPENNTLSATGWVLNPSDYYTYQLSPGISLPYGAQIFLDAQPVSGNATIATQPTPATGSVTFTDVSGSATISSTQTLNASGVAEWSTGVFAPGSHAISESYPGDASYNPSIASAAASFTVTAGSTTLTVKPLVTSVAAGASVSVDVVLNTGCIALYGALPTGTVIVTLGGQKATAAMQAFGPSGKATLEAVVTFSNLSSGVLPLSASYSGDGNWLGSSANGASVIAMAGKLTPTVRLSTNNLAPTPSQSTTLTATVAGPSGKATPTGSVAFLTDNQSFDSTVALSSGSASLTIPGYALANGSNVFTAIYTGDGNYTGADSSALNITVAQSDYSLTTQNAELSISPSGSGVATLAFVPLNGFNGSVTIASSTPAGITVTPAAASLALTSPASDALTINVAAGKAAGIYPLTITASGGGHTHTAQILIRVLIVAAPTFTPVAGSYTGAQSVTLADATAGASIYYTTNGTTPTASSTLYGGAIAVSATETIQAIAVVSGYAPSSVTSASYTINYPPVGNLEIADDGTTGSTTIPQTDSLYVKGWVADPVDGSPMSNVKVYIDGVSIGTPTLDLARTDVSSYFNKPSYANSGFSMTYSAASLSVGTHAVTVVAIDTGGRSTTLAPLSITVAAGGLPPVGNLEIADDSTTGSTTIPQTDSLYVKGWVADPVDGSPMSNVKVYIDGVSIGTPTLDLARTDVSSYFNKPSYANSGFSMTYSAASLSVGTHAVTVVAIDTGGRSTTLAPLSITVTSH